MFSQCTVADRKYHYIIRMLYAMKFEPKPLYDCVWNHSGASTTSCIGGGASRRDAFLIATRAVAWILHKESNPACMHSSISSVTRQKDGHLLVEGLSRESKVELDDLYVESRDSFETL